MTYNQKPMTVKLTRRDVCDLLLACTAIEIETDQQRWRDLHDKLTAQLDAFDEKNGFGIFEQ